MSGRARRLSALVGAALFCAGAAIAAPALWLPAKAAVGQWLLERAWAEAREGGTRRPWAWADIEVAARLTVPRLGVSEVVLADASGEAMAWGPGMVAGTGLPGERGLAAIAGHRDSHLAFLADVRPGDEILVDRPDGQRIRFVARGGLVVDARHWRFPAGHGAGLALATCWPFESGEDGPLRFVLFADPAVEEDAPPSMASATVSAAVQ